MCQLKGKNIRMEGRGLRYPGQKLRDNPPMYINLVEEQVYG